MIAKKHMNMTELRDKLPEELHAMADTVKKEMAQAVLDARSRGEHAHIGARKKDLARILTVIHQKRTA